MHLRIALVTLLFACSAGVDRAPGVAPAPDPYVRWPFVVDSHVHLAYYPVADRLLAHGVGFAVDLGSPEAAMKVALPIHVIRSGLAGTTGTSYLELDGDPRKNADVFTHPHAVIVRGKPVR